MTSKVNGLDTTDLLLSRAGSDGASDSTDADGGAGSSNKGALLDAGHRGQLAGHRGAEGLGEAAGGHCDWRGFRGD